MKKIVLPYADTGYFSKAVTDYLSGSDQLKSFYQFPPSLASFPELIKQRSASPGNRQVLHDALIKQHKNFRDSQSFRHVFENMASLQHPNTFTVVTAHQPNLFLGPLYLIYKIISTINLAKRLNKEFPSNHFVPVYWMGSEDHDKDELNHIHLFGKKLEWNTDQQGAFGRMKTASLDSLIKEISAVLGDSEDAKRCAELLQSCYLEEERIASATRKLLYHFFATDGLIIIDGDDHELKKLFIPVLEKELFEQFSFPIVTERSAVFSKNYPTQIAPREINLFYLDEGMRQRIVKENDRWIVLNTPLSFSEAEIKNLVESQPEKFSPNVVLRPVYQEAVLPNIAFIGGGAEVTYWMQLKSVFEAAKVPFPMLLLRNSVLWIDHNNASRMEKLHISPQQIFKPAEVIINNYLQKQSGGPIALGEEKQTLNELMEYVLKQVMQVDASLKGAVEAEKAKMVKSMEAIEDKLRRAAKKKEELGVQQIQTLREKLFPENSLQERHENFLSFYLRTGDHFFEALKLHLDPLELQFTILSEA